MADLIRNNTNPIDYVTGNIRNNGGTSRMDILVKDGQNSVFYQPNIQELSWNQSYPFKLSILELTTDKSTGHTNYDVYKGMEFTLPIPPQNLEIRTQFANNVTPTFGGVAEEYSRTPFRLIVFAGTTGVLPLRGGVKKPNGILSIANTIGTTIAAGTVSSATRAVKAITNIVGNSNSNLLTQIDSINLSDENTLEAGTTGFYQFHLLRGLLEFYERAKLSPVGKNLRLAFSILKEDSMYLVTPVAFDYRQTRRFSTRNHLQYPA